MVTTEVTYLDPGAVAVKIGVSVATVHTYLNRGTLPPPDDRFGNTPVWLSSTIDEWKATRPGQGKGGGRPRKATT